jgi:hypothetical protein
MHPVACATRWWLWCSLLPTPPPSWVGLAGRNQGRLGNLRYNEVHGKGGRAPPDQLARRRRIKNTAPADKLTTTTAPKTSNPASSARSLGIAGVTQQRKPLRFALANTAFVILRADIKSGILWSRAQKIPMGCFPHANPNGPIELGRQNSGGDTCLNDRSAFSPTIRKGGSVDGGLAENIGAVMKRGLQPLG